MQKGNIPVYGGNGITGYHSQANVFEETIVIGRVGYYCGSIHLTHSKAWVTDNAFITRYNKLLNRKHSKKCTLYAVGFDCSFALAITIKPK